MPSAATTRAPAAPPAAPQAPPRLEALRARIIEQRKLVETSRKSLNGKRLPIQNADGSASAASAGAGSGTSLSQEELDDEIWEQRELCISKLAAATRDELELREREQQLRADREEHFRQMRAIEVEDHVGFGDFPMLQSRYQLLRLLSRSVHMTIYRAFDLSSLRHVAVRTHIVDPKATDPEERLKSASNEATVLRDAKHPGILGLLDHFNHESHAFATVWELLDYDPLDMYLRRNGVLPEKEARGIVMQLLSMLRCMEAKELRVDPLDLGPPNLLVRAGDVKVSGMGFFSQLRRAEPSRGNRSIMRSASGLTEAQTEPCGRSNLVAALDEDAWLGDWTKAAIRAIGATLHEMLFNRPPVAPEPGAALQLPDCHKTSAECREFLCHVLDRERRLSLAEVSQEPFVAPPARGRPRRAGATGIAHPPLF
mmetsp:Transcript_9700/g.28106  ORF Transcript_9700/g.28106 Transcript_9700/m.28106 type:complete len:427 (+) Transcript_9700:247-1527(+)